MSAAAPKNNSARLPKTVSIGARARVKGLADNDTAASRNPANTAIPSTPRPHQGKVRRNWKLEGCEGRERLRRGMTMDAQGGAEAQDQCNEAPPPCRRPANKDQASEAIEAFPANTITFPASNPVDSSS